MSSRTSETALGTSDLHSSPATILRRISVPEYMLRLYMGEARTSNPDSSKRRRVRGLFVYTLLKGGDMETTWATHTE